MKRIILFCSGGMSSSLLIQKIENAAKARNFECEVTAYGYTSATDKGVEADVILLAPQVRFAAEEIRAKLTGIPVLVIEMMDYGTMNGEHILTQILNSLES